ncbi:MULTISPECIES: YdeI/OmpD-associated family protein [unclassified Listeria]|uniref:YdeI/OmpD-associated family protein n=1 Tax=unclassified Listeria TaxID=2642072 RepID=UPI000B589784|nr:MULTISPECIES: YdeI/OmpD-associated family protein [unclassified Listeria]
MAKSIVEKLNLTKYANKAVLNVPQDFIELDALASVDHSFKQKQYDLIFGFALTMAEMEAFVNDVVQHDRLAKKGYLFVAYPKKGNSVYDTFVHRDEIMPTLKVDEEGFLPKSSLKFSRMVSMDDTFTVVGMKEAFSEKGKSAAKAETNYAEKIPDLKARLADDAEASELYEKLAAGYQKTWASYVFSAKQTATEEKRLEETKTILKAGFKSKDLYRQNKK